MGRTTLVCLAALLALPVGSEVPQASKPAAVRPATSTTPASNPPSMDRPTAERAVLERFDAAQGQGTMPIPKVSDEDRPDLLWLVSAATAAVPRNPFPPGSAGAREAEALLALHAAPPEARLQALETLAPTRSGTYLGLWRWGKALSRERALSKPLRIAWENALLAGEPPPLILDYTLRHALCLALLEADDGRLGALKSTLQAHSAELAEGWQRLFGILGSGTPSFRFWRLPGREVVDGPLGSLGRRIWIQPAGGGALPVLPEGTQWIAPARDALQPDDQPELKGADAAEARRLEARLKAAGRSALFAASRTRLAQNGLVYFPILLELDGEGRVLKVAMGDAAPAAP